MALATITDYQTLTGTTVAAGAATTRVEELLSWAESAILDGAHGQAIEEATTTDEVVRFSAGTARLSQRPVSAVAQVKGVYRDGTTVTLTADEDYRWTAGGNRRPAEVIRQFAGRDAWWNTLYDHLLVTYTHGWDPVPGPIKSAVCAMAKSLATSGGDPAMQQVAVGPFSGTVAAGENQSPSLTLTASTQAMLDRWCGVAGPTSTPVIKGAP